MKSTTAFCQRALRSLGLVLLGLLSYQNCMAQTITEVPASNTFYNTPFRNVLCLGGHLVTLTTSRYLLSCTVSDGYQLTGKTGGNGAQFYSCASSQPVMLGADGYLNSCLLYSAISVGGKTNGNGGQSYPCKAGYTVEIKPDGYLNRCTLANDIYVGGRVGPNGSQFYLCKQGSAVAIGSDGYLSSCTLDASFSVITATGRKQCNAQTVITIDSGGYATCN